MENSGLLPCPFCGGKATLHKNKCMNNGFVSFQVRHRCKYGFVTMETRIVTTGVEAIRDWNKRSIQK